MDVERISVPIQGVSEEYHDYVGYAAHDFMVEPLFFEQTDYVVTIKARNGEALEFQSNSLLVEERIGQVLDDDASLLSGVVNFGNNVGFSDFIVTANSKTVLSIRIEVYPTKIAYKEDYQEIAYAFSYMKLMEHWGSGIPRIIETVVEAGLREPKFVDGDIDLRISIYRGHNGDNNENVTNDVTNDVTNNAQEKQIILMIKADPSVTQVKMAEMLGVTTRTIKRILARMQEAGMVSREGTSRAGKWVISQK